MALSLLLAFATVPGPAHAVCAWVSIREDALTLDENTSGYLHIDGVCDPGDYEIFPDRDPEPDFHFEVEQEAGQIRIRVDALGDGLVEIEDQLVIGVRYGQWVDTATVTIPSDPEVIEGLPVLSLRDVKGSEIDTVVMVDPQILGRPKQDIIFTYDLIDGTAKAWEDYIPVVGGVGVIKAGQQAAHIPVGLRADGLVEADEYFFLRLTSVSGAAVADEVARVTIEANAT